MVQLYLYCYVGEKLTVEVSFMKEKLISRCFSDENLDNLAIGFQHVLKFAIFQSTDIADTAYHCEWYNLPPKDAGLLVIIMCRATSSPLKLTAGKFCSFTILLYSQASGNKFWTIFQQTLSSNIRSYIALCL